MNFKLFKYKFENSINEGNVIDINCLHFLF